MANVGYATLSVIPSLQGFQSSLGAQLGGSAVTATAKKEGSRLGSAFGGSITRAIGTSIIGYAAFTAITGAIGAAKYAIIDFNAQQQNAEIAFTNFFGSAKQAKRLMGQLLDFARTTPFEIVGLTQNAQSLLAMGISAKDLIPTLTAVGDAVAAVGGDAGTLTRVNTAIGQIAAKGRVQGEELRQLTENGIPAVRILANQYKLSQAAFLEFVTAGKVNAAKALPLLLEGIEKGTKGVNGETAKMGGLMEAQSKTFTGALSNIKDGFNQVVGAAFKPFFDEISQGMAHLATVLGSDKAKQLAANFAKGMRQGFSGIGKIVGAVGDAVNPKPAKGRPTSSGGPGNRASGDGPVATGSGQEKAAAALQLALAKLAPVIKTIGSAWASVSGALVSGFSRVAAAAQSLIGPLAAGFDTIWKTAGPKITELGQVLSQGITQITTAISTNLIPAIRTIIPVLAPIVGFFLGIFLSAVVGTVKGIINIIRGLVNIISGVVNIIAGIFTGNWSQVWLGAKQVVAGVLRGILGIVQVAWNIGVIGLFRKGLAVIKALFSGGFKALTAAPRATLDLVKSIVRSGLKLVGDTFRVYMAITRSVWKAAWGTIASVVRAAKGAVVGAVKSLLSSVKGALAGAGTALIGAGRAIVDGLVAGIQGAAGRVTGAAKALVDKIPSTVKKLLNIHSPSKVMEYIGREIPNGLIKGMKSKNAKIRQATAALANDVRRGFTDRMTGTVSQIKSVLNDLANDLDKAGKHHAANVVDYVQRVQLRYAKQRDALKKQISSQKSLIADLKKQKADLDASVRQRVIDTSNFLEFGGSIDGILAKLHSSVAITREFQQGLAKLRKSGLNQTTLLQLANANPEDAIATIRTLLGNKGAIGQINGLVKQIGTIGVAAGHTAGSAYDAGIKTAEGLLKGLQSKESLIEKYMKRLADKLAKTLRKSLGIKSPSRVTREIGAFTGEGLAVGLRSQQAAVQKAADAMLPAFPRTLDAPTQMTASRAGDGLSGPLAVHVHIGDRELTDIVKVEVKKENVTTARALTNGRR